VGVSAQGPNNLLATSTSVNYAPVADPQVITLSLLQPVNIALGGYDANGDALSFAIVASPLQGTLSQFDPSTGHAIYTPSTSFTGSDTFTFSVTDGIAISNPAVVNVVYPASSTLSASAVKFGNQGLANTSNPRGITVKNSGTVPLRISGLTLNGPNASNFAYTSAPLPITLAPMKATVVKVTFTPSALGSRTAALAVFSNAATSPQTVMLSGQGVQPVTLSPSSLNFGLQTVGTTSAAKLVTLTNNNSTPITIYSVIPSGDFSVTTACSSALAGKGKCLVSITFTPTAKGLRIGSVDINDSASNSPQTISLRGTGQ
jgi:hypothetical protein